MEANADIFHSSSLQRIETMDRKMSADIEKLTKMMIQVTHQSPDDSALTYQSPLTEKFIAEAEIGGRRWFSFGFDEWLQAGQWWLMACQGRLYSGIGENGMIGAQPYANLLKASSILLDILPRHPSIRLWDPTKEYLQFQLLAGMLRRELEAIKSRDLQTPDLELVQQFDLRIWTDAVRTVHLEPARAVSGPASWDAATEETLFQGFGTFTYDRQVKPEECLILILVSKKDITEARVVAQNQRGAELVSLRINFELLIGRTLPGESDPDADELGSWPSIQFEYADCLTPLGNGVDTIRLGQTEFAMSSEDFTELSTTLRGIIFCQGVKGVAKSHALLHGVTLLFAFVQHDRPLLESTLNSCQARSCLEYAEADASSVLHLARSIASKHLKETSPPCSTSPSLFSQDMKLRPELTQGNMEVQEVQCIYYWFFDLCLALTSLGYSLDWARPMKMNKWFCELSSLLSSAFYLEKGVQVKVVLLLVDYILCRGFN